MKLIEYWGEVLSGYVPEEQGRKYLPCWENKEENIEYIQSSLEF